MEGAPPWAPPGRPLGAPNVIRTGRTEHVEKIPRELLESVAVDAEHLRLILALGLISYMVVPMRMATLKIFCDHIEVLASIGEFLGPRDDEERRALVR